MWTDATREKYEREAHRYASDLSDTEWCVIEPHMPPARALGRPRKTDIKATRRAFTPAPSKQSLPVPIKPDCRQILGFYKSLLPDFAWPNN